MNLLRYRLYRLSRDRQFWAVLPLLLLVSLALSQAGNGHLFLIPSVLCCLTACGDYDKVGLIPVLSAGYSRKRIHITEIWWIMCLNLLTCAVVRLMHMGIFWESYQAVSAYALCKPRLLRGLLAMGNTCVFLFLSVQLHRKEALLVPGFLMTALEAGVQGNDLAVFLGRLFPSGGLSTQFPAVYILESLMFLLLIHILPFYIPSKIHAK